MNTTNASSNSGSDEELIGENGLDPSVVESQRMSCKRVYEQLVFRKDSDDDAASLQSFFDLRIADRRLLREGVCQVSHFAVDGDSDSGDEIDGSEEETEREQDLHSQRKGGFASALKVSLRSTKRRLSHVPKALQFNDAEEEKLRVFLFDDLLLWGRVPFSGKGKVKVVGHAVLTTAARPYIEKSHGNLVEVVSDQRKVVLRPCEEGQVMPWTVDLLKVIKANVRKEMPVSCGCWVVLLGFGVIVHLRICHQRICTYD